MTPEQKALVAQLVKQGMSQPEAERQVASGGSQVVAGVGAPNGGAVPGSLFSDFRSQVSTEAPETTIPVWRTTFKRPVRDTNANGKPGTLYTTSGRPSSENQFAEADAQVAFGTLLMDQAKMKEWSQLALRAGLISPTDTQDAAALNRAWNTAVGWAVNIKQASKGDTEVTPFEAAKLVAQNTGSALLAQQAYAADHFTGDRTTTSTTIDKRNATSGAADVLHKLLGRNPTAGEKATYQHGLNAVAAANPEKTTSVGTYKDGQQVSQTNTITGGYDEQAAALEQATKASPAVAPEQQATTFYDALIGAIGAAA